MAILNIEKTSFDADSIKARLFCVGQFKDEGMESTILEGEIKETVSNAVLLNNFKGKKESVYLFPGNTHVRQVAFFGLGELKDYNAETARIIAADIAKTANKHEIPSITIDAKSFKLKDPARQQAFLEGLILGTYNYDKYKSKKDDKPKLEEVQLLGNYDDSAIENARGLAEGVFFARDLANAPANDLNPPKMAEEAEALSKFDNVTVSVIDESKFLEMGMGAFYAVGQASVFPSKLIQIEYKGGGEEAPVALVGKGLTFDSGGISIKPAANMDQMKMDMGGAATVLGTMRSIAELQPKINVVATVGAAENMPGGNAQRPGDIVTAYNGKTIEILNTDAEGRLVLADVLAYTVEKFQPVAMFDFATLTGAVVVALGPYATGVMGNDEELMADVISAGKRTYERVWQLPLWPEYSEDIKSKIADIKNMGKARQAGTIAAAAFLKEFVGDTPWVHFDVAATAMDIKTLSYVHPDFASGICVRLVYDFLQNRTK